MIAVKWLLGLTYCLISSDDLSLRMLLPISRQQKGIRAMKASHNEQAATEVTT